MATATESKALTPQDRARGLINHFNRDAFKAAIAQSLPKHITADRMVRVLIASITRVPHLVDCTPASIHDCMMRLSQFGLEPDGYNAHLIPYYNNKANQYECQLIIDYKGLVALAYRSGVVANIHADIVCEFDEFDYDLGEIRHHRPRLKGERGAMYAVYAICKFKDGGTKAEVMTLDEVEAIRKRSKSGDRGPWKTDPAEMQKKSAFRRLSKWLPLSPEHRDALYADDDVPETIREVPNLVDGPRKADVSMADHLADMLAQQQSGETNVEQEDDGDPNALEGLTDALSEATTTDAINAVELKYAQFCNDRQIAILQEACQLARRKLRNGSGK